MKANIELSKTIHNWLTLAGNKINAAYCNQEIVSHADYPALTAAIDFLEAGNMGYQAFQADVSYIHEFNYPLIAHIKEPGNEYMHIIPTVAAWDLQKDITQYWSGVVVFPEKNTRWNNPENNAAIKKEQNQKLLLGTWFFTGASLFIGTVYFHPSFLYNLFGFLSLAGIVISIAAFATELGIQSNTIKQVCGAVSKGGCETVLKSKLAKGALGRTPADAAILYFTTQFIVYLADSIFIHSFSLLPYLALAGIAIVAVSIYTQAIILKQWCALCLGIAGVLTLQVIVSFFIISGVSFNSVALFAFIILLLTVILIPIKTLAKNNIAAKPKLAELKKWKADAGLFMALIEKEQTIDTAIWQNDLLIGNPDAALLITVACNPYCGPCATAHEKLDELLHKFNGRLKVQLRLLCNPENETDKRTIVVKAILQKANSITDNNELKQLLTDWFSWMDYEKWNEKWGIKLMQSIAQPVMFPFPLISGEIEEAVLKHTDWMDENNITHTPTFFINGRRLPGRYGLNDVERLIPQLTETIKYYNDIQR